LYDLGGRVIESDGTKLFRTLLRVVIFDGNDVVVMIPAWDWHSAVRFKFSMIPEHLREKAVRATHLMAMVNIGAIDSKDLRFEDFEVLPPLRADNPLA
jgi:hypothetical protein